MLRAIIKTMASPSGNISDLQNAEILAVLTTVWRQKGNEATITDVANECLLHPDDEMKRIGKQLKPFCEGGLYGDFFGNKYPPVDYNSRLIVCELEELKSDIHLQVVVLMSVMVAIQHAMYLTGSDRRKMLIIDEGWEYLKEDGNKASMMQFFAEFLETAWRRLRKTNGSGALVTQSVMDGYGSAAGRAIINNSAWLLLMKQNLEAVDRLESEKMYAGSKSDFSLIRSLRTVKPNPGITEEAFSEVFVRYEGQKQVCRLYTDRKLQLILTTNPDEKAIRKSYMDRGMTLVEATEAMYRDEIASAQRKAG
jgi:conjugal transfer ATP-binding protein TraC